MPSASTHAAGLGRETKSHLVNHICKVRYQLPVHTNTSVPCCGTLSGGHERLAFAGAPGTARARTRALAATSWEVQSWSFARFGSVEGFRTLGFMIHGTRTHTHTPTHPRTHTRTTTQTRVARNLTSSYHFANSVTAEMLATGPSVWSGSSG